MAELAGHTPEPWRIIPKNEDEFYIVGPNHVDEEDCEWIALVYGLGYPASESAANARLMCDSPKLLRMVKADQEAVKEALYEVDSKVYTPQRMAWVVDPLAMSVRWLIRRINVRIDLFIEDTAEWFFAQECLWCQKGHKVVCKDEMWVHPNVDGHQLNCNADDLRRRWSEFGQEMGYGQERCDQDLRAAEPAADVPDDG